MHICLSSYVRCQSVKMSVHSEQVPDRKQVCLFLKEGWRAEIFLYLDCHQTDGDHGTVMSFVQSWIQRGGEGRRWGRKYQLSLEFPFVMDYLLLTVRHKWYNGSTYKPQYFWKMPNTPMKGEVLKNILGNLSLVRPNSSSFELKCSCF